MSYSLVRLDSIIDFNPKRLIKKGTTAPFVEMAAIPEDNRDISYVFEKDFKGSGSKFTNGDTLFARITPCLENGKTAKVDCLKDNQMAHGSTEFIVMSAKEPEYDGDFVYYLCRWPKFREFAKSRMEGTSGRQRVDWKVLAASEWELPPKEERKRIGNLLKQFDDKIANNNHINQTLEQIAQALFKSWFVDFEPVKAKIKAKTEGKDPQLAAMCAISGKLDEELQQLPHEKIDESAKTADLFPDKLVESELGLIPEGWNVKVIKDIAEHIKKNINPSKDANTLYAHYSLPAFDSGRKPKLEYGGEIKSNKYKISNASILISKLNPTTPRIWDVIKLSLDNSICSTEFQVAKPKEEFLFEFVSLMLKSQRVINELAGKVTGTSKSHQRIKPDDIFNTSVIVPDEDVLKAFSLKMSSSFNLIDLNIKENINLSDSRDTLLSKLLSCDINLNE